MKKQQTQYFNRELSWLAFNQRVLDPAIRDTTPLLERVKFLAITASNLDEFFMVRVGGLKVVDATGTPITDILGWTAEKQLSKIRERVLEMNAAQSNCLLKLLEPALTQQGIVRMTPDSLNESQHEYLLQRFRNETLATIAPLAIEDTSNFPMLSGARLCLCVRLKNNPESFLGPLDGSPPVSVEEAAEQRIDRFVLLPLGRSLSRIWTVPSERGYRYMLLEDIIGMFLPEIFPNQEILEWTSLRITRNGDVEIDEDGRSDLLVGMTEMLEARRTSDCVRLEISASASDEIKSFLQACVGATDAEVYPIEGPLALSDFFKLASIPGFKDLKDEPWPPQPSPDFGPDQNIFETIAAGDRLLYHPYQSYDPVVEFIKTAAEDPSVIAIKQTLYRTSSDSEIAEALKTAAANGKNVTAIVELKARFDEARNIYWARHLEFAGVDVIYGVQGLKTHAKLCIVVRKEPEGIRRYMHFGTGNYNESTARLYSDVSLFTCDEQLGHDAVHFFNAITGLSVPQPFDKLSAAPINLRETLLEMIQIETENASRDIGGQITIKVNSLVDQELIDALYVASQAGVKIKLNIRGICCLVPGKKNLSENIRVISVVDRFLEHARIFHFSHGGDDRVFISSADWMGRNLNRRVELMTPVQDEACKRGLTRILKSYFEDNVSATELQSDGEYVPVVAKKKKGSFRSQEHLYQEACQMYAARTNPKTTVFQPHRAEHS
ncbi:polyphosphate kinase 1 [Saprospiraceae bacterium]|nr:polyphosphate kinase 1 [Saprospiraceae bacterium]